MTGPAIPARLDARAAMPMDSFLGRSEAMKLDDIIANLEGTPSVAHELKRSREQIVALAAKFAESEYAPLLEWLLDISLRRPVFLPGLGQEAVAYVAHREGQNNIVWQLVQAIAEGRSETPPQREGL